jgi:hypothetical protein
MEGLTTPLHITPSQPTPDASRVVPSIFASLGLMSAEEMSTVLQVSPQTLATWRCKKRGPPSIKLGKKVFYLISDFSRWTQEQARAQQGWRAAPYKPTPDNTGFTHAPKRIEDF